MRKRLHIEVYGRVQGVCFRYYTVDTARAYNLTGWVKNRGNGSVEIVAEGEENDLSGLLDWVKNGGPPAARIDNLNCNYSEPTNEFKDFTITY